MEHIRFGSTNLIVSRLGLGAMGLGSPDWRPWVADEDAARRVLSTALDAGINFIDTCDFYSAGESEAVIGRYLGDTGTRREIVIATKLGNPVAPGPNGSGYSRKHIVDAVDASLRRLGTDHIDLLQTHIWRSGTDLEEMMSAFDHLVRSGKVLYLGATDMPAWQVARANGIADRRSLSRFVSIQHQYNLLLRESERELIPFAIETGLQLLPYSPYARGVLWGRDRDTERLRTDEYIGKWYGRACDAPLIDKVAGIARSHDTGRGQVALAWLLAKAPQQIPLFGATEPAHVADAIGALDLSLDDDEMAELSDAYMPRAASDPAVTAHVAGFPA